MKKIILSMLFLLLFVGYSHSQTVENDDIKVERQNFDPLVKITNKQSCSVSFKLVWYGVGMMGGQTVFTTEVASAGFVVVSKPSPAYKLIVTALTDCNDPNYTSPPVITLDIFDALILDLKFTSIKLVKKSL